MHIAVNAQLLNTDQSYRGAGVSNYSRQLLSALGRLQHGHRITAFLNDAGFQAEGIALRRTRWPARQPLARIVWEQCLLPVRLQQEEADLVHGLVNVLPLATSTPGVVTVHDLSFLQMPEAFHAVKRLYLTMLCRHSVARARRIVAVSQQTASDLVHAFGVAAERIKVVYNGVGPEFSPVSEDACRAIRRRLALPERFILYLGTLEPRKNVLSLVEAYSRWRQASAVRLDIPLVIAGGKGWFYDRIFARVKELGLEDCIRFPGYIPAEHLPDWYRAATVFVYPSKYEGFGLPVLEAMASGTPVICTRAPGVVEVAGQAAYTVPSDDTASLVEALGAMLGMPDCRAEYRRRGLERATQFSWQRAAQETLQVYEQVL